MKTQHFLFLALLSFLPMLAFAQKTLPNEPSPKTYVIKLDREPAPNEFIITEREPQPINLDSVKSLIKYPGDFCGEGKVLLRILIDQEGKYVRHIVLKDPHPILTKAVTDHISAIRFTPATMGGKPVKLWMTLPFDFRLGRR